MAAATATVRSADAVVELRVAHTAELDARELTAARALLDRVFGDELDDSDWEHALGGMHALAYARGGGADVLVGHASVIQRRLIHDGRALRAGYVEGVGVDARWRRRGVGTLLMDAIEDVIRKAYDLGGLGSTDDGIPFYASRGWRLWRGDSWALTPGGVIRTAEADGAIFVLPVAGGAELALDGALTADWREGDQW
ncbi:MAG TPA: GNAT family N-acetyltransferase [Baekduia sp.]